MNSSNTPYFLMLLCLVFCFLAFKPKFAEPQRSRDERDEIETHGYTAAAGISSFLLHSVD